MRSVKLITPKRINKLYLKPAAVSVSFIVFFCTSFCAAVSAQDNSPYSRYGIGDLVPATNINYRAMGGVSAAVADHLSVNFNNPASYSMFQAFKEAKSNKLVSARVLLD